MVGWLEFARITAVATCKTKAFELAVEKVAEPKVSVAAGLASSSEKMALLALESSKRAAPARTCTLPDLSVLIPSPLKMVVPTKAGVAPMRARSAYTTVPSEEEGAAHTGAVTSEKETSRARILFAIASQRLGLATVKHSLLLATARRSTRRCVIKRLQEG